MERKEGRFTHNGTEYDVIDLPGSYSLSAGSDEEKITADYIRSGRADLVAILVDSSQLERSLYMYTDFIGTNIPVVLVLNLMDVAEKKGIHIDVDKLSRRTGIPVIGFVASDAKRYGELKEQFAKAVASGKVADQSELVEYYRQDSALSFDSLVGSQKDEELFTKEKLAISELEKTDRGLMIPGDIPGSGLRWESSWRRLRRQWLLPHRSWGLASGLFRLSAARSERSLSSS